MCMWGYLDKYIRVATWHPQTKIPGSAPAYLSLHLSSSRYGWAELSFALLHFFMFYN